MNASGIQNKVYELEKLQNLQQIDEGQIKKKHLTKESYIKLKGFIVYSTNHPENDAEGESAIIIKNSINHYKDHPIQSK